MNGYLIISLIWALFAPGGAGGASHLPVYARLSHSGNGRVFMRQSKIYYLKRQSSIAILKINNRIF
jgi:ABC-type enterochelin transport system ATPase subunit